MKPKVLWDVIFGRVGVLEISFVVFRSTLTPPLLTLFYRVFRNFPIWDAVLRKRLAWALFVLLLSTLVCLSVNRGDFGLFFFFLFHNFPILLPPGPTEDNVANSQKNPDRTTNLAETQRHVP